MVLSVVNVPATVYMFSGLRELPLAASLLVSPLLTPDPIKIHLRLQSQALSCYMQELRAVCERERENSDSLSWAVDKSVCYVLCLSWITHVQRGQN